MTDPSPLSPRTLESMLGIKVREVRTYGGGRPTLYQTIAESAGIVVQRVTRDGVVRFRVQVWDEDHEEYIASPLQTKAEMVAALAGAILALSHQGE